VLTILAILGYVLLTVLALVLLLIALVLWSPIEFAGHGAVLLESTDQDGWDTAWPAPDGDDAPDDSDDGAPAQWPVGFDARIGGEIRFLWGAVALSDQGIRLFWWRRPLTASSGTTASSQPLSRRAGREHAADSSDGQADDRVQAGSARRRLGPRRAARLTLADVRRLLPDVRRSLARSWQALRLRLRADITLGLADPATTGLLAGAIPAAGYLLTASTNAHQPGSVVYSFSPVFDREVLAADFALSGRTTLGSIGWPWLRLALRRDVRRLWWPTRRRNLRGGVSK
jgi:hypothetical protein